MLCKEKGSLGDATPCWLVPAEREGFTCDRLYNGIGLCLQVFTSGLWISEVLSWLNPSQQLSTMQLLVHCKHHPAPLPRWGGELEKRYNFCVEIKTI